MHASAGAGHRKNHPSVTKQSWRVTIKLSIIIDNLISARPVAGGRIGGDDPPFNLGEATVSCAAVRLASGVVGFGYTLGRDGRKALVRGEG